MAQKGTRIDDVKRPGKVAPSATSRPILVSSQSPAVSDPMMVQTGGDKDRDEAAQVMSHTAKTITPPSELETDSAPDKDAAPGQRPEEEPAPVPSAVPDAPADVSAEAESPSDAVAVEADEPKPADTIAAEHTDSTKTMQDAKRDPEAAVSAEESAAAEARVKREEELEQLVASGKYAVPINAVQLRRSRMHTVVLTVAALLLAVALLDVAADAGIIELPSGVPHTHFFSGK